MECSVYKVMVLNGLQCYTQYGWSIYTKTGSSTVAGCPYYVYIAYSMTNED